MDTRTVPQWIVDREMGYQRAGRRWETTRYFWLVCLAGWLAILCIHDTSMRAWLGAAIFVVWTAVGLMEPGKRAQRYRAAAKAIRAAIEQYEGNPDMPESALGEANRLTREDLRTERFRTAPKWIRRRRFRCSLGILGWGSPVMLVVVTLPFVAVLWRPRAVRPWDVAFPVAAIVFLLLVAAGQKIRKLLKARDILSDAVERYEFQSVEDESTLTEANRQASEALLG